MFRQNRDTWQIWARIPVIIISILGNIVLSDFYIGLTQFRRPYVPIFRSFSNKNAGFKSKKITRLNVGGKHKNRKSAETRRIFMPEWHILRSLPLFNIGLCLHSGGTQVWFWCRHEFESRPIQIPVFQEKSNPFIYQLAQFWAKFWTKLPIFSKFS